MWTIEEGLEFIRRHQFRARALGYCLNLGGGVLNNGRSAHDLDITCTPVLGSDKPTDDTYRRFVAFLHEIGGRPHRNSHRYNDLLWKYKFTDDQARIIEFFVVFNPNESHVMHGLGTVGKRTQRAATLSKIRTWPWADIELPKVTPHLHDISEHFQISRITGGQQRKNALAMSIFWKNPDIKDGDMDAITPEHVAADTYPGARSKISRYLSTLRVSASLFHGCYRDWEIVIFLASDLEFLAAELARLGCRVIVMTSNSIRHSPGAMWRFLIMDMDYEMWTCVDSDDKSWSWAQSAELSEETNSLGLAMWRVPGCQDLEIRPNGDVAWCYRAIQAGHFGGNRRLRKSMSIGSMLSDFVDRHKTVPTMFTHPTRGYIRIFGSEYPQYGFDELFLSQSFFPDVVKNDNQVLTAVPVNCEIGMGATLDFATTKGLWHTLNLQSPERYRQYLKETEVKNG